MKGCSGQMQHSGAGDNSSSEEVIVMSDMEELVEVPDPVEERPRAETKKLEMVPEEAISAPAPHLGLTREETNWAAVAHASFLVTLLLGIATGGLGAILGVAIPAIIWYVYRDKSEYVVEQARQATVFQLAGVLGWLLLVIGGALLIAVGWMVGAVLVIILVGLLLLPIMLILTLIWVIAIIGLPIAQAVYACYAAAEAYNGRPVRYRWFADAIDRYQAQS
jgi:uncharacterized Tic20 family protein